MKYQARAIVTVSAWTIIEAESEAEAREIAEDRELGTLCHNAIYPDQDEVWHFDGDGLPCEIRIEKKG